MYIGFYPDNNIVWKIVAVYLPSDKWDALAIEHLYAWARTLHTHMHGKSESVTKPEAHVPPKNEYS